MTATVCQVQSCIYHRSPERCSRDQILVAVKGARAFCSSYRNHDLYETGPDSDTLYMSSQAVDFHPEVGCQAAGCLYNTDGLCYAAAIEVIGDNALDSTETLCKTFLPVDEDDANAEERVDLSLHVD
ncbi:MAG: DUF1540 domain-containing protein [Syntrophomonadaceae bacterium]|jgi:hypothetical protein|nr:DUF1540 domain-containing protein [Syntrophomonadaceae bacterium]